MIDIEAIQKAAMTALHSLDKEAQGAAYVEMRYMLLPCSVLELIARLKAAEAKVTNLSQYVDTLESKLESTEQDAAMFHFLATNATQQADNLGPLFRIDIRRKSMSTLFNFRAAVIAAMKESE